MEAITCRLFSTRQSECTLLMFQEPAELTSWHPLWFWKASYLTCLCQQILQVSAVFLRSIIPPVARLLLTRTGQKSYPKSVHRNLFRNFQEKSNFLLRFSTSSRRNFNLDAQPGRKCIPYIYHILLIDVVYHVPEWHDDMVVDRGSDALVVACGVETWCVEDQCWFGRVFRVELWLMITSSPN